MVVNKEAVQHHMSSYSATIAVRPSVADLWIFNNPGWLRSEVAALHSVIPLLYVKPGPGTLVKLLVSRCLQIIIANRWPQIGPRVLQSPRTPIQSKPQSASVFFSLSPWFGIRRTTSSTMQCIVDFRSCIRCFRLMAFVDGIWPNFHR